MNLNDADNIQGATKIPVYCETIYTSVVNFSVRRK